ncbi:PAS domain S-box protein [Pseudomonas sp. HR96]|uniref:PAS domain S-box protein n=1 Tax=Pseudomonas sp. HR96 TaxID=1027966 RepID=UPI002A749648|nr:PAS domain S-box protein [Pseudomonas sp. HR96]WPP01982.1 PAS domain S-box protein [Pseudomonas sp. HR96]
MSKRGDTGLTRWGLLALAGGLAVSALVASLVGYSNREYTRQAVTASAQQAAQEIATRLHLYQYGLLGARGAVLTAGEQQVTRDIFRRYSQSRDFATEFPGARGFGFVRRVPQGQLDAYVQRVRASGQTDFTLKQIAPHAGERFIIEFIEPGESNQSAIGYDIASEPYRREAALAAMANNEVRLTAPITLMQTQGHTEQSYLVLLPVYRGSTAPASREQRLAEGVGWAYAPLVMEEVIGSLQLDDASHRVHLRDVTNPDNQPLLHGNTEGFEAVASASVEQPVFGRRWQVEISVNREFVRGLHLLSPYPVLGLGALLSVMLSALLMASQMGRLRRQQALAAQGLMAAIVESSTDAIITKSLDGHITSWNGGARQLLGYSAEEAIGQSVSQLLVPDRYKAEERAMLATVQRGESVQMLETRRRHRDGHEIDVSISVSPVRDPAGRVIGASKSMRDISAQKAADVRLRELNSHLEELVGQRTEELTRLNVLFANVFRSSSEVSIIATDLHGIITIFNRGAEYLLGYSAHELIGHSTPAIIHLHDEVQARGDELSQLYGMPIHGFRALVHQAEVQGSDTREWTYLRKDASQVPVSLVITSMRDDHGALIGYLGIAVDITERRTAERELAASVEQLQHQHNELVTLRDHLVMATDIAELGIWTINMVDNTVHWSERMNELYELDPPITDADLSYAYWYSRLHPEDAEAVAARLAAAIEGSGNYETVYRILRNDGSITYIQSAARIERDAQGRPLRLTGINRDITARHALEAGLLYAKEQADAASAAKSYFLANMSHEIRTPMNAVLGMLQLINNTPLNPRQQDYVGKAQSAARSLLGLLNDILDYSKIEAGKMQIDAHTFELESLMQDLAVVMAGNEVNAVVEVAFDIDPQVPALLVGDSLRLQQILINLGGNALKFTQQGHVVVSVQLLEHLEHEVQLRVAVTDTGIGIDPSQLERIFEGFNQAEPSTSRRFGGTGLGLVISRRLLNLMGSDLEVQSTPGVGSRFWFDITLGVGAGSHAPSLPSHSPRQVKLLVVDDNREAGHILQRTLQALGWQADYLPDGGDAATQVVGAYHAGKAYDVVLMDWKMPGSDGLSSARSIHERCVGFAAPVVIMVTAYGREVLADAREAGDPPFVELITKPATPRQLHDAILKALKADPAALPELQTPPAPVARLEGVRLLVVEDNALNRFVALELLRREGAGIELAEGGVQALAMLDAASPLYDLVLMDVQMPDLDGLEVTRRLRANPRFAHLPIIAMTANASQADRDACLAAGMDDHIGKPIDINHVVEVLRRFLLALLTPSTAPGEPPLQPVATIIDRFGGDGQLFRGALGHFEVEMGHLLTRLEQAVGTTNRREAGDVLHSIKGCAGTMGAQALANLAGHLEPQIRVQSNAEPMDNLIDLPIIHLLCDDSLRELHQLALVFAPLSP